MKQNTSSQRIVSEIRARIRSGKLLPGDLAPSARQIVKEQGVAIATATKVLAILKREGLVRIKPGIGTVVRAGERGAELSRERIVEAAVAIADDEGTGALSMRTLARELGVATMSLYRHVGSKEELFVLMADSVFGEDPLPKKNAKKWRVQIADLARIQWAGYKRHPWLAQTVSMTRPEVVKNGMRHTEAMLAALDGHGLDDQTMLRIAVTTIAYVRGMAVSMESELLAEVDTGQTSDEWMATQAARFVPALKDLPLLARITELPDVPMGIDVLFECGLELLLAGIASRIAKKA